MATLPSRPRTIARAVLAVCGLFLVIQEVRVVAFGGASLGPLSGRGAHDVVLLAAALVCLARGILVKAERWAWLLLGAGVLAWTGGEIYYTFVLWDASDPPIPSPADIGYLLFPVLALAGMIGLLRARTRFSPALVVDGAAIALAVAALSAAIVFQTVLAHASGQPLAVATSLAYPITDLILLAVGAGALAGTGWRIDRTWLLLAAGILAFWLADSLYLVRTAAGTYEAGGWFDIGWWFGLVLIAVAAWQAPPQRRHRPVADDLRADRGAARGRRGRARAAGPRGARAHQRAGRRPRRGRAGVRDDPLRADVPRRTWRCCARRARRRSPTR